MPAAHVDDSTVVRFAPGATAIARGERFIQFGADATRSGIIDAHLVNVTAPRLAEVLAPLHSPTRLDHLMSHAETQCGMSREETLSLISDMISYRVLNIVAGHGILLIGRSPLAASLADILAAAEVRIRRPLHKESVDGFLAHADPHCPLVVVDTHVTGPLIAHAARHRAGASVSISRVDFRVFIGPVGYDRSGPCLHCAHLYHLERDANWPHVATLSVKALQQLDPLVTAAGAAAGARVVRHLCGVPDPPGVTSPPVERGGLVTVDPYAPHPIRRSTLRPHPDCPVCY